MKVLLLGATGQLGSDLLRLQAQRKNFFSFRPFTRKELDLSQLDQISRVLRACDFEVLINATGYNRVNQAEVEVQAAMILNAHVVKKLAEICKEKKARFVHISTDFVFGGEKLKPYLEEDLPCPMNVYGSSKAIGEGLALSTWGETFVLRTASLFGVAGSPQKGGNFVETILQQAKNKDRVTVVHDVIMSPTATKDLAGMILTLLEKKASPGIYHTVNSGHASWFEFAKEILTQAQIPSELIPVTNEEYPQKAKRPEFTVLDNSKATAIVGPIPHWKEALRNYLYEKGHIHIS